MDSEDKLRDELPLDLIAEIQALTIAFKRLGEQMAARNASHEESALMLLDFFQKQQIATTTYKIYLDSIQKIKKNKDYSAKQIERIHSLCAKKLLKRYNIKY